MAGLKGALRLLFGIYVLLQLVGHSKGRAIAVVMAYNRPQQTAHVLAALAGHDVGILVVQSCESSQDQYTSAVKRVMASESQSVVNGNEATDAELAACFSQDRCSVHTITPTSGALAKLLPRGTAIGKLESTRNLLAGIRTALRDKTVTHLLIAEDDSQLSQDAISGMLAARDLVLSRQWQAVGERNPSQVSLVVSQALLRPGLIRDMEGWNDITYSDVVQAAEREWSEGASTTGVESVDDIPLAARIDVRRGTARTILRTFLWMTDRQFAIRYQDMLTKQVASLRSQVTASRGMGGLEQWCVWCQPLCYDHVLEAAVHGKLFASFAVPRASSPNNTGLSGQVSVSDTLRQEYRGPPVPDEAWLLSFDQGPKRMRASTHRYGWSEALLDPQPRPAASSGSNPHTVFSHATATRMPGAVGLLSIHPVVIVALQHPTVLLLIVAVFEAMVLWIAVFKP